MKPKCFHLTPQNYYTEKNTYLSNSKYSDYLFDPYYFYLRHIKHELPDEEPTKALTIGSAVDSYIFDGTSKFMKKYKAVERRNLKEPPKGYTELSLDDYKEVIKMGELIKKQSCYKILEGFEKQKILQWDMDLKWFTGLCGKPDWFKIEGNKATIVDLKTSRTNDLRKYYWHCVENGYFNQMGFYQMLLKCLHPELTEFEARHLVLCKNEGIGFYNCSLFILDQDTIDLCKEGITQNLEIIKNIKEWKQKDASWDNPAYLINLSLSVCHQQIEDMKDVK